MKHVQGRSFPQSLETALAQACACRYLRSEGEVIPAKMLGPLGRASASRDPCACISASKGRLYPIVIFSALCLAGTALKIDVAHAVGFLEASTIVCRAAVCNVPRLVSMRPFLVFPIPISTRPP
jgi:hypothetical protein